MSIKDLVSNIKRNGLLVSMHQLEELYKLAIENEEKLAVSQREFRAADATIENLQMQLNAESEAKLALAAENAGLSKFIKDDCFIYTSDDSEPRDANDFKPATPDTDAFLAEVRAQGVEMLREHPAIKLCSLTHVCDEFAAQLRQEAAQ